MSGTLTIINGSNRKVKVISKANGNEEIFVIPNDNDYQLILQEDCKIIVSKNRVNNTSCWLQTDENSNITMKVLKMSNSETVLRLRFNANRWLKEFNHNVRENWDNVDSLHGMFNICTNLTTVTLPNTLPSVVDMGYVFQNCTNLTTVTLPNTLPRATTIHAMFRHCASLPSMTLLSELPNVIDMQNLFYGCSSLTSITLPNTLPSVTIIERMFYYCTSFNGNLSNTQFKSNVNKGSGDFAYDYNTPLWEEHHKPQFVL